MVRLPASLISGPELFFLLLKSIPASVRPLLRLFPSFASASTHVLASFLGLRTNGTPRLAACQGRVKNTYHGAESQSCQEPQETIAITIGHS